MRADALGLFWEDKAKIKPPPKQKIKRLPPPKTWERADYLPYLEEAQAFNVPLFTDKELMVAAQNKEPLVFDIECYPNYFLIAFMSIVSEKVTYVEMYDGKSLDLQKFAWIMSNFLILSFNGNGYDMPMASLALSGMTTAQLRAHNNMLIEEGMRGYQVLKKARVAELDCNHIDVMEVAPLSASLKMYSGRCHAQRMQDLPFNSSKHLTMDQISIVRLYCVNDLENTKALHDVVKKDIELRIELGKEYKVDVRSKSDAQAAEAIIKSEIARKIQKNVYRPRMLAEGSQFTYKVPHFLKFKSSLMQWVLERVADSPFTIDHNGNIKMHENLEGYIVNIAGKDYRMGMGGLHSTEKTLAQYASETHTLEDHDVASYYPRIILNQRLYPEHLGPTFLKVYKKIVDTRLAAKARGDKGTADTLKIVINGSFGKLGSSFSILYAPQLLIQVTLTGQLSLLMLIERLELVGIPVVSANTDGIVVKCPVERTAEKYAILDQWQKDTRFDLDHTPYAALYSKDVNNYIAVKADKSGAKTKGAYAETGLSKNPTNFACVLAVKAYLLKGTPIANTIYHITDVRQFLTVRAVKGGAVFCRRLFFDEQRSMKENKAILKRNGWKILEDGRWYRAEWKEAHPESYEQLACSLEIAFDSNIVEYGDFLGKAIRWYYSTEERGVSEIVYAKRWK